MQMFSACSFMFWLDNLLFKYNVTAVGYFKILSINLLHQIKVLTHHLFADWKELKNSEELEIMKLYTDSSRRFSLLFTGEDEDDTTQIAK